MAKSKNCLLSIRLSRADLASVDMAASRSNLSRANFVREAAVRAAEDLLLDPRPIRMSPEGFADLLAALDAPAAPVPEMIELLQRPASWETADTPPTACASPKETDP